MEHIEHAQFLQDQTFVDHLHHSIHRHATGHEGDEVSEHEGDEISGQDGSCTRDESHESKEGAISCLIIVWPRLFKSFCRGAIDGKQMNKSSFEPIRENN